MEIYEILERGRENALSQNYIADLLGYTDKRDLRREIERERWHGHQILSCTGSPGGYFLPANEQEALAYRRAVERRAKRMLLQVRIMFPDSREIAGQLRFEGGGDG